MTEHDETSGATEATEGFWCSDCGSFHEGPPFDYAAPVPDILLIVPEEQREDVVVSGDLCWIRVEGNDHYFVRGVIPIPVLDSPRTFNWGVWAQISPEDFTRLVDLWDSEDRWREPAFPGLLGTDIAVYPDTLGLPVLVQLQGGNQRPTFEVDDPEHPLASDQREGISVARVQDIAEALIHPP